MTEVLLRDPGFVPNDADGTSCLHACIQMIMRTSQTDRVFTFEAINTILRRTPGRYSWVYAMWVALKKERFRIKHFSTFDIPRFIEEPENYLIERFGEEAGRIQITNMDVENVLEDARELLKTESIEPVRRVPTVEDIRDLLSEGWYVLPLVNFRKLNGEEGYSAHYILLYGYNDDEIVFHDPGLPPVPSRRVSWRLFEEAWSSPRVESRIVTGYCYTANLE